jgi:hypothetical protein
MAIPVRGTPTPRGLPSCSRKNPKFISGGPARGKFLKSCGCSVVTDPIVKVLGL